MSVTMAIIVFKSFEQYVFVHSLAGVVYVEHMQWTMHIVCNVLINMAQ